MVKPGLSTRPKWYDICRLQNAASVASLLLTTEAYGSGEAREERKISPHASGGGLDGGMEGMY